MHTKNAKPHTARESAYLADVKRVGCVFCPYTDTTEAHHPKGCQGLHWLAVSACKPCHDARVWTFGAMTELQAINETRRRVDDLREKGAVTPKAHQRSRQATASKPLTKIVPRNYI